jgi:hypothetical protein
MRGYDAEVLVSIAINLIAKARRTSGLLFNNHRSTIALRLRIQRMRGLLVEFFLQFRAYIVCLHFLYRFHD